MVHNEGLLILAGAGSAETRVLSHRVAYLIDEKNVNPWNILAISIYQQGGRGNEACGPVE